MTFTPWTLKCLLALCCLLPAQAQPQGVQRPPRPQPPSDVFSTGSGGPLCSDTNRWIHAHSGRWDRCQYERECPGPDTLMHGPPDRFPATDGERMRGYARCAVDPCTPGGAQCWARQPPDAYSTRGEPEPPARTQRPGPPVRILGGYDPCANPVPAPGCPNAPRPAPPSREGPRDCIEHDARAQESQQRLRQTGIEAIDTIAAMGQQADRMLQVMGTALVERAAYLAQPNDLIWEQRRQSLRLAGEVVASYLSNDAATAHNRLRKAAERAIQDLRRDPAGYLGVFAADVLTGRAGGVVQARCRVTLARIGEVVAERARTEKAVRRLKAALDHEQRQRASAGAGSSFCSGAGSNVNPTGLRNACVPSSWADELNDEIGQPQFTAAHFKWEAADIGTPWDRIYAVQKQMWGDRRFAGHDPTRAMLQSQGMPAIMQNGMDDIIDELRTAGPGASGLVTIRRSDGSAHVFRARNIGGSVRFTDSQLGTGGSFNFDPAFNGGPLSRVDFFRTTGRDRVP